MTQDHLADLLSSESVALRAAGAAYDSFHKARFDYLMKKSKEFCPGKAARVLDVGRSRLTLMLLDYYDSVSTLDYPLGGQSISEPHGSDGKRKLIQYEIFYDLNKAQTMEPIATDQTFDLVVFAEVIEHLYTAPELTLFAIKRLMKPGGIMILQTPNAAALYKRLLLLFGQNPYEKIRINFHCPGHFREYTKQELIAYAHAVELEIIAHEFQDYFGKPPGGDLVFYLLKAATAFVPPFKRGQTLVLRKPK